MYDRLNGQSNTPSHKNNITTNNKKVHLFEVFANYVVEGLFSKKRANNESNQSNGRNPTRSTFRKRR